MKNPIEKSLVQYGLILGVVYQLYQSTADVFTGAPVNSVMINIIITIFLLLLLFLSRLEKSISLVASLIHVCLLPAFIYFWYYNGGIAGLVPFILCAYFGFIIATTNGWIMWTLLGLYTLALTILLFFQTLIGPLDETNLNLSSKPIDYFIVAIIITLFTIYLKNKYLYFRKQVAIRNIQLQRVANTLVNQNEKLQTQREEIKTINENLEAIIVDHTLGIELRNKELGEYAFINAHMLRGPLSRILGLASLMEIEPDVYNPSEVQQIKKLAREMDSVVRKINEVLS